MSLCGLIGVVSEYVRGRRVSSSPSRRAGQVGGWSGVSTSEFRVLNVKRDFERVPVVPPSRRHVVKAELAFVSEFQHVYGFNSRGFLEPTPFDGVLPCTIRTQCTVVLNGDVEAEPERVVPVLR